MNDLIRPMREFRPAPWTFHIRWSLCALSALSSGVLLAQHELPILRTNTPSISIREGGELFRTCWTVSPELRPDVFVTHPFTGSTQIIFYSDIDSISFHVTPDRTYDLIILLGADTAFTRINTASNGKPSLTPKVRYTRINGRTNEMADTIPFHFGTDNFIHLKGTVNGSDTLDIIFDTGAGACVISSAVKGKNLHIALDGSTQNNGSDGTSTIPTSSSNTVRIAGLEWKALPLLSIDYAGFPFDAVLGWNAFEDKVVEIDHPGSRLIIHPRLPTTMTGYSRSEMKIIGGIPYILCDLIVNGRTCTGWFDLDTGSDGSLIVGHAFATEHGLGSSLQRIGSSALKGSTGNVFEQTVVLLPELRIGEQSVTNVRLSMNTTDPVGVNEIIGNQILKRFDAILDAASGSIYLRPNHRSREQD